MQEWTDVMRVTDHFVIGFKAYSVGGYACLVLESGQEPMAGEHIHPKSFCYFASGHRTKLPTYLYTHLLMQPKDLFRKVSLDGS